MSNPLPQTLSLLTSKGTVVKVDRQIAEMSVVLKTMIEDLDEEIVATQAVPLTNIKEAVLIKVIQWCERHRNDPPVVEDEKEGSNEIRERITLWDREFIKDDVDYELLYDIIMAANFLEIKQLLDLGCITVADLIRGMPAHEVREFFGLKDDFSPEEREQIEKELLWYVE